MLKIKSLFRVNGLFLILFWLFLFFKPELALDIVVIIFAIELIISWIAGIAFVRNQKGYKYRGLLFFGSLLQILFWFFLLVAPGMRHFLVSLLIVLLGLAILVKGILTIFDGLKARDYKLSTRRLQLLMWGIAVLFWLFLITNAFLTLLVLNILFGLTLIITGIVILVFWFQAKEVQVESIDMHEIELDEE